MTKLIQLDERRAPTFCWFATSGLFEWVNQFIRARIDDQELLDKMYGEAIAGYLFIDLFQPDPREVILRALREELAAWVDAELYPPPLDVRNNEHIMAGRVKNLARMAWRLAFEDAGESAPSVVMSQDDTASVERESLAVVRTLLTEHLGDVVTQALPDEKGDQVDLRALPEPVRTDALRILAEQAEQTVGGGDGRVLAQMARVVATAYPEELGPWPPLIIGS